MAKRTPIVNFRETEEKLEVAQAKAEELGVTLTDVYRDGGRVWLALSTFYLRMMAKFCKGMNITPALFLENVGIAYLARLDAEMELGLDPTLDEFMFTAGGPVTNGRLYETIKRQHISNLKRKNKKSQDEGGLADDETPNTIAESKGAFWTTPDEAESLRQEVEDARKKADDKKAE